MRGQKGDKGCSLFMVKLIEKGVDASLDRLACLPGLISGQG